MKFTKTGCTDCFKKIGHWNHGLQQIYIINSEFGQLSAVCNIVAVLIVDAVSSLARYLAIFAR